MSKTVKVNIAREMIKAREIDFANGNHTAIISIDFIEKLMWDYNKIKVNAISDDFKKILEDESDCFGIHLTKGTIRGSEALDSFEIWINKLLKK